MNRIGLKIKEKCQKRGMTQKQLAAKLNVSQQAISKWMTGTANPTDQQLDLLSRVLGISRIELLQDRDMPTFNSNVLSDIENKEIALSLYYISKTAAQYRHTKELLKHWLYGEDMTIDSEIPDFLAEFLSNAGFNPTDPWDFNTDPALCYDEPYSETKKSFEECLDPCNENYYGGLIWDLEIRDDLSEKELDEILEFYEEKPCNLLNETNEFIQGLPFLSSSTKNKIIVGKRELQIKNEIFEKFIHLVDILENLLVRIGDEDDELILLRDLVIEKLGCKIVNVVEYKGQLRAIYNVGYFDIDLPYCDPQKPDVESVDSISDKVDIPEYVPISLERARSTLLRYVNVDEYYYQLKTLLEKREWNYDFSNNKQQFFIL